MAQSDAESLPDEVPALVLAPLGADARALSREAEACGIAVRACDGPDDLAAFLDDGGADAVLLVLVSQEGAGRATGEVLERVFAAEPDWARLPVVFLVSDPARMPEACRMLDRREHAPPFILLQRPVPSPVLRHALVMQAEARRRQFATRDLLERLRAAEQRRAFLLSELRHRVRNSLAVLQSLFRMSVRRAESLDQLSETFTARLENLIEAHERLSRAESSECDLARLIEEHVTPYAGSAEQLRVAGPPVAVHEQAAFDLAMVVHELATNAAKYGALSEPGGRVEVAWSCNGESGGLHLDWRERGGPRVDPPARQGLGTRIIEGYSGNGLSAELHFEPGGLVWTATLPPAVFEQRGTSESG